ncbi:protein of unknown function [Burkholderia sp. YR290]|nr:protein of unknown function [Burkholderia sp. YR290]
MKNNIQKKPTIFISSTVYDFRDLRSALKFYLEDLGYIVNMSEFTDFERPLNENSYTACLQTVMESDYYILLIGSRAGGPYVQGANATITQQEYRTAYDTAKTGSLRILTFVRSEIWAVREDRKALERVLKNDYVAGKAIIEQGDAAQIARHASAIVNDAEQIFSFIKEVCRIDEMSAAIKGNAPLPTSNWVHQFETFRDIIDCLRVNLKFDGNIQGKMILENLKSELLGNLALLFSKSSSGEIANKVRFTQPFRQNYSLVFGSSIRVKCRHVLWMIMGSAQLTSPQKFLSTDALRNCLDHGLFCRIDSLTGKIEETDMHRALRELNLSIQRYLLCAVANEFNVLTDKYLIGAKNKEPDAEMLIACDDFAPAAHAANMLEDVYTLTLAIVRILLGENVDLATLPRQPLSPYPDHNEMLADETVSVDEAMAHLEIVRN